MAIKFIRSPRYPVIGLREAIEKVAEVYKKDNRNKIPKSLVAEHMKYGGLNGASLGVISAVSKYGLLDGGIESMWVTARAVDIIERERTDPERIAALRAAANEPDLYRELNDLFPEKASDAAIRAYLITKRQFLPDSAMKLIRSYRETCELVDAETAGYESEAPEPDEVPATERITADAAPAVASLKAVQGSARATVGGSDAISEDEREWIRGPLSRDTRYRLIVSGDMGPREIGKLIKLLEAQKAVLDDDEYDDLVG
jgi:hypothetical protein